MNPLTSAVNCKPSVIGRVSPESERGGIDELDNNEHGHTDVPEVVKVELNGVLIGVPPKLLAPETVTAYTVPAESGVDGVKLADGPIAAFPVDPGTTAPEGSVSVMVVEPGWTDVSKLTEIADETETDVD